MLVSVPTRLYLVHLSLILETGGGVWRGCLADLLYATA